MTSLYTSVQFGYRCLTVGYVWLMSPAQFCKFSYTIGIVQNHKNVNYQLGINAKSNFLTLTHRPSVAKKLYRWVTNFVWVRYRKYTGGLCESYRLVTRAYREHTGVIQEVYRWFTSDSPNLWIMLPLVEVCHGSVWVTYRKYTGGLQELCMVHVSTSGFYVHIIMMLSIPCQFSTPLTPALMALILQTCHPCCRPQPVIIQHHHHLVWEEDAFFITCNAHR